MHKADDRRSAGNVLALATHSVSLEHFWAPQTRWAYKTRRDASACYKWHMHGIVRAWYSVDDMRTSSKGLSTSTFHIHCERGGGSE